LLFVYILPQVEENILNEKRTQLLYLTEVVYNQLKEYKQRAEKGEFTEDEAKERAKERIRHFHYDKNNYFWVHDLNYVMIVHPKLEGKNIANLRDVKGKKFIIEMNNIVEKNGEGFVNYWWIKPNDSKEYPKLSYVKIFKEWGWIIGTGIYIDDVEESIGILRNKIYFGVILLIIIIFVVSYYMTAKIKIEFNLLKKQLNNITEGNFVDYDNSLIVTPELVDILKAFGNVKISIQNILADANKFYQEQKAGDIDYFIDVNKYKEAYHEVSNSINEAANLHIQNIHKILNILHKYSDGDTSVQLEKLPGKQIVVNQAMDKLRHNLANMLIILNEMSKRVENYDLNYRIDHTDLEGEFKKNAEGLNKMIDIVREPIRRIVERVNVVASSANQISSSTEEMAAGAQETNQQAIEMASSVEEMTKTILETSRNTTSAAEKTKETENIATESLKAMQESIEGMNRVVQVVEESAQVIMELGKSSEEIGLIIQVIDEIADQTNLLALNAAIEAARAGEQGRGFVVVADEVRKLAERTGKATKEIADKIKGIQVNTKQAVEAMKRGTEEAQKGKEKIVATGEAFEKTVVNTKELADLINQVAAAAEQQSATSEQISHSIENITTVIQETSQGINQISQAAIDLSNLTINLQELLGRYKI